MVMFKLINLNSVLVALILCAGAVGLTSCNSGRTEESELQSKGIALPVLRIDTSDATTVKSYLGTIEGKVNVEIRPQVVGVLQEIYVDEGVFVEKGEKLFKIDASSYQEELNNAIANQNVAKAKLENAKLEVERLRPLVENDVISPVRLESALSDYEVAKATLDQAGAAVRGAEISKDYTIITAPVSGYIGRIPKRIGNLVSSSDKEPLTVLSDVQEVYVYFSMNEADFLYFTKLKAKEDSIKGIEYDKRHRLNFPDVSLILADGEEYSSKGVVDAINGQVDRNTGAISLRATFPNEKNILRSGSTGTLKVSESKEGVIQVPQIATSQLQDRTFVFVLNKENKAETRNVKIGGKSKDQYIITEGLKVGDRVILSGLDKITEGSAILPLE